MIASPKWRSVSLLALMVALFSWPHLVSLADDSQITTEDKNYWAFQPLSAPPLPTTQDHNWSKQTIDRFVLARLEAAGLKPVAEASPRELIRRVSIGLTGLPPAPTNVDAFLADSSPDAFAKVVARLLDSPHYGERWGRYWLDVARYAEEDVSGPPGVNEYRNAWRYRDWVAQAFNDDMPYDLFVKAQIAGDLMTDGITDSDGHWVAGTGFLSLGIWYYSAANPAKSRADERFDRIDVLSRGFFGLTVGCARCHDHKYDPISVADYYALDGIMASTVYRQYPLAPAATVKAYNEHNTETKKLEVGLRAKLDAHSVRLSGRLAHDTARYLMASERILRHPAGDTSKVAQEAGLDQELLESWVAYLTATEKRHPYLQTWDALLSRGAARMQLQRAADEFQSLALAVFAEKSALDKKNDEILEEGRKKREAATEDLVQLPNGFLAGGGCDSCDTVLMPFDRTKYILWLDLFGQTDLTNSFNMPDYGLFRLRGATLERFLPTDERREFDVVRKTISKLKSTSPPEYPYLHTMGEATHPRDGRIHLSGNPYRLGAETPRRFLTVLSSNEPQRFTDGSGRLQLAKAIAAHPLTARVIVNRVWQHHFGRGIVSTPSNFGKLGSPPSHPDLLEYLASQFVRSGYSLKALHREILLSSTYQLSSRDEEVTSEALKKDPDNLLLWRAHRRRLDAESLRDSLLLVSERLDRAIGGPSVQLTNSERRRTLYARISRSKLHRLLTLFDFPEPTLTAARRNSTNVPLQRLFFLNSDFVWEQAVALAKRFDNRPVDGETLQSVYRALFQRRASSAEIEVGLAFLREHASSDVTVLQRYLQVLLSSNEFLYVD